MTPLAAAVSLLRQAGVANAAQEARWLLRHAAPSDAEAVPPEAAERFRALVRRRAAHEPLQYLLGSAFFLGLEFEVTPATLIPRPETELLVEEAARRLGEAPSVALDLGTGSGCVAIGLTHLRSACRMLAVERSFEALQVARRNSERHGVADRVAFVQGDWTDALRLPAREGLPRQAGGAGVVDAVVSNPPYIPTDELRSLPLDVQREPRAALDGGPDGLAYHRRVLEEGTTLVRPGGWLLMELGISQAPSLAALVRGACAWTPPAFIRDHQGIERILVTRRRG